MRTNEQTYEIASFNGMYWIQKYLQNDNVKKAIIEFEMMACICAEIDRSHKKPATCRLQKFVWTNAYILKKCTKEEFENSGYFDEKFLEKLLTKLQKCGIINTEREVMINV